jgi:hypothetical protein
LHKLQKLCNVADLINKKMHYNLIYRNESLIFQKKNDLIKWLINNLDLKDIASDNYSITKDLKNKRYYLKLMIDETSLKLRLSIYKTEFIKYI